MSSSNFVAPLLLQWFAHRTERYLSLWEVTKISLLTSGKQDDGGGIKSMDTTAIQRHRDSLVSVAESKDLLDNGAFIIACDYY